MTARRRVLVIHPNSSASVTAAVDAAAAPLRLPDGPEVTVAGLAEGPPGIAARHDADGAVMPLVDWAGRDDADAFVLSCFSDPGLHAVREAAGERPVRGVAERGILRAITLGERFGSIALSPASVRRQRRTARRVGVDARRAAGRPDDLGAAAAGPAGRATLIEAGRAPVQRRGADVAIPGCAGMASHRQLTEEVATGCPVIEPSQRATAAAMAAPWLRTPTSLTRSP